MFEPPADSLFFPHAVPPANGAFVEIAPGILWLRLALPFALDHVNIYLIEDDGGWAVVDTGLGDDRTRAAWIALLDGPLAGSRLTRLIVTHFHPDHVGLASFLCTRYSLPLFMSRTEYLFSLSLQLDRDHAAGAQLRAFHQSTGLAPDLVDRVVGRGFGYLNLTTGLPPKFRRLAAGDQLAIGARRFEILTGGGHAPEQVMLLDRSAGIFLSADQVLAKISPNVSVWAVEPEADPLGDYLASLANIKAVVPADVLVLACHNLPFVGLHQRIDALMLHHRQRCAEIAAACKSDPKTAADIIPVIFHRPLDAHQTSFAIGEVVAHLNYMLIQGTLMRDTGTDGVHRYTTC